MASPLAKSGVMAPMDGESSDEFLTRGQALLAEKAAKNAAFLRDVILDENKAEDERLKHLRDLESSLNKKKSKTHRSAKSSALRLYEMQRLASRNKVEALIHDCNISVEKLRGKFEKELAELRSKEAATNQAAHAAEETKETKE